MFMTIPAELLEAARIDGAGPWRFFVDVVLSLFPHEHRRAVRGAVHLRLEPVPLAPARHQPGKQYTIVMGIQRMVNIP